MIPAESFYRAFDAGFTLRARDAGLIGQPRKGARWKLLAAGHDLQLAFPVNRKASAVPYCPGEFWPVISWSGARYSARDDGTVSYYQYATDADVEAIQAMRRAVVEKAVAQDTFAHDLYRQARDNWVRALQPGLDQPLRPQTPDAALYYLDEGDAGMWGRWFGSHITEWLRRFGASPETLDASCWRVLWGGKASTT